MKNDDIKENNINKNISEIIEKEKKMVTDFSNYLEITSFSDLLKKINGYNNDKLTTPTTSPMVPSPGTWPPAAPGTTPPSSAPQDDTSVTSNTQPAGPAIPSPFNPATSMPFVVPSGTTPPPEISDDMDIDPRWDKDEVVKRWSPANIDGKIYEWDRGVIGISNDGIVEKESLDESFSHHADATVRIVQILNSPIPYTDSPFLAGILAIRKGIIIIQTEGSEALVYMPDSLTKNQLLALQECLQPRKEKFKFSLAFNGKVIDETDYDSIMSIAEAITSISVEEEIQKTIS